MVEKVRVNITVDKKLLEEAKKKLGLFGGKLSTLFNAYLSEFVKSIDKKAESKSDFGDKIKNIEKRLEKIESYLS
jgi:hypothetical protein